MRHPTYQNTGSFNQDTKIVIKLPVKFKTNYLSKKNIEGK